MAVDGRIWIDAASRGRQWIRIRDANRYGYFLLNLVFVYFLVYSILATGI